MTTQTIRPAKPKSLSFVERFADPDGRDGVSFLPGSGFVSAAQTASLVALHAWRVAPLHLRGKRRNPELTSSPWPSASSPRGAGPPDSGRPCQAFPRLSAQIGSVRIKLRNSVSLSRDKARYGYEDWTCCGRISTKREVSPEMKPMEKQTDKVPQP